MQVHLVIARTVQQAKDFCADVGFKPSEVLCLAPSMKYKGQGLLVKTIWLLEGTFMCLAEREEVARSGKNDRPTTTTRRHSSIHQNLALDITGVDMETQSNYLKFRGKCKEMSEELTKAQPELTLVRGHYYCPIWNRDEPHWWCVGKMVPSLIPPSFSSPQPVTESTPRLMAMSNAQSVVKTY